MIASKTVQRPLFDALVKTLTLKKLHRDERVSVRLADLVDMANVGMAEGSSLRFSVETLSGFLVFEQMGSEELEGNGAFELGVLGLGRVEWWRAALRLANSSQRDSQCRLSACAGAHLKLRFHHPP